MTYQLASGLQLRPTAAKLATFGRRRRSAHDSARKAYGALPGPFLGLAAVIALMAVRVAGASMAFVRLLGGVGVSLGAVVLLVLGNSTSGGSLPPGTSSPAAAPTLTRASGRRRRPRNRRPQLLPSRRPRHRLRRSRRLVVGFTVVPSSLTTSSKGG